MRQGEWESSRGQDIVAIFKKLYDYLETKAGVGSSKQFANSIMLLITKCSTKDKLPVDQIRQQNIHDFKNTIESNLKYMGGFEPETKKAVKGIVESIVGAGKFFSIQGQKSRIAFFWRHSTPCADWPLIKQGKEISYQPHDPGQKEKIKDTIKKLRYQPYAWAGSSSESDRNPQATESLNAWINCLKYVIRECLQTEVEAKTKELSIDGREVEDVLKSINNSVLVNSKNQEVKYSIGEYLKLWNEIWSNHPSHQIAYNAVFQNYNRNLSFLIAVRESQPYNLQNPSQDPQDEFKYDKLDWSKDDKLGNLVSKLKKDLNAIKEYKGEGFTDHNKDKVIFGGYDVRLSDVSKYCSYYGLGVSNLKNLHIVALNKIIFDQNIKYEGCNLSIVAPVWCVEVEQEVEINLSGAKGAAHPHPAANGRGSSNGKGHPGADGSPGNPGESGGNFLGIGAQFEALEKLSIISNGGQGGDGQDGGNGADGENGEDAPTLEANEVKDNIKNFFLENQDRIELPEFHSMSSGETWSSDETWRNVKCILLKKGMSGAKGGDGGKKGSGGIGGKKGNIRCISVRSKDTNSFKIISNPGPGGHPGQPGCPGKGGKDGKDRKITIIFDTLTPVILASIVSGAAGAALGANIVIEPVSGIFQGFNQFINLPKAIRAISDAASKGLTNTDVEYLSDNRCQSDGRSKNGSNSNGKLQPLKPSDISEDEIKREYARVINSVKIRNIKILNFINEEHERASGLFSRISKGKGKGKLRTS